MGRTRTTRLEGLPLETHRQLAGQCTELRAMAQALRATVRQGLSSGSDAYGASSHLMSALKRLETALMHELMVEHAGAIPMGTLKAIYHGDGEGA